jgi:hypothetical protein
MPQRLVCHDPAVIGRLPDYGVVSFVLFRVGPGELGEGAVEGVALVSEA